MMRAPSTSGNRTLRRLKRNCPAPSSHVSRVDDRNVMAPLSDLRSVHQLNVGPMDIRRESQFWQATATDRELVLTTPCESSEVGDSVSPDGLAQRDSYGCQSPNS